LLNASKPEALGRDGSRWSIIDCRRWKDRALFEAIQSYDWGMPPQPPPDPPEVPIEEWALVHDAWARMQGHDGPKPKL
jgi:hypothetical protein